MSDFLSERIERMEWDLEVAKQLRGACSCGDSTLLGVIHSDTRPCHLPTVYMPLTDDQIWDIWRTTTGDQKDFARKIEQAHGIGGINAV